jgi:hypothetical protein
MGNVSTTSACDVVMPEILTFSADKVLLVHGKENGREFWWPPGAYWIVEKSCDLSREQPQDWVTRVLSDQLRVSTTDVRLRSVEFIQPSHPPVLIYEVRVEGEFQPSSQHGFDDAKYFPVASLPVNLGRDTVHGEWLKNLLGRVPPASCA